MRYHDLSLSLNRLSGDSYEVWAESPAGQTRGTVELPSAAFRQQVEGLRLASSTSWKHLGIDLFHALFQGDLLPCYAESLGLVGEAGGLRIRIQTEDPELVALPWELLYDTRRERFLALSLQTPVVRSLRLSVPVKPLAIAPPLEVLMATASPIDYPRLSQSEEEDRINSALAILRQRMPADYTLLPHATLARLQQALRERKGRLSIFHFAGHAGPGALIFEDEQGRGARAGAEQIALLLQDTTIRLALLNGCQTASLPRPLTPERTINSAASSLLAAGLPAVIAMQQDIRDRAALAFAHTCYASLIDGYPIEACVTEARKALVLEFGLQAVEWFTPVLFLRAADGLLFELATEEESKVVSNLALNLSLKLDIHRTVEKDPELQTRVRRGYQSIAGKLQHLLKVDKVGLEIKIERTYGPELELLSPCNTAVVVAPAFTWQLGSEIWSTCREVLEKTGSPEPIEMTVSLHGSEGLVWQSPTQRVLPPASAKGTALEDPPQSIACPENVFAGLEGGEAVHWWELLVSYPVLDLEGTTRRTLYRRAYFRKLSEEERDMLEWLETSIPLLSFEKDGMDETEWYVVQGAMYESFDLYDEAIFAYQQAERLTSEGGDLWGHLQRVFYKKAFAVLGPAAEGLLNRPIARYAAEANAYRDRMCKRTGATPTEKDRT